MVLVEMAMGKGAATAGGSRCRWELPEIKGVPYFGVLILRILLFGVLHWGPLFSETPIRGFWLLKVEGG